MANILVDFCVEKHGLHPSVDEKMALAKAGVALFPAFRIKDTKHGIVSSRFSCFLYDSS